MKSMKYKLTLVNSGLAIAREYDLPIGNLKRFFSNFLDDILIQFFENAYKFVYSFRYKLAFIGILE